MCKDEAKGGRSPKKCAMVAEKCAMVAENFWREGLISSNIAANLKKKTQWRKE